MVRGLWIVALLATAASADSSNIVWDWMKAHGMDMVEAATECAAMTKAIEDYKEKCQYASAPPEVYVAGAVFYAITGLEHVNGSVASVWKESQAIKGLKVWASTTLSNAAHDQIATLCNKPECVDKVKKLVPSFNECFSSILSTAMSDFIDMPPEELKDAWHRYFNSVASAKMRMMCTKDEEMDGYYCGSLPSDLFFKNSDCARKILNPNFAWEPKDEVCQPGCADMWKGVKAHVPTCSALVMEYNSAFAQGIIALLHDFLPKEPQPQIHSFDDICTGTSSEDEVRKCVDVRDDWTDDVGYNCEQYAKLSDGRHCEIYGHEDYGSGTARAVCCSCGGGKLSSEAAAKAVKMIEDMKKQDKILV